MNWLPAGLLAVAPLVCAAADDLLPLQNPLAEHARRAAAPAATRCAAGEELMLPVETGTDAPLIMNYDAGRKRLRIVYRMLFNDLTEGWNWHPRQAAAGGDYYVFKFLPLGSTSEDRSDPQHDLRAQWRYDYFFAFDNPYDFYPRPVDDDAGFAAEAELPAADAERLMRGDLRMAVRGRLYADCLSESTTYWNSIPSHPVTFTLKKRYLIGRLEDVWFYDAATGWVLARLAAPAKP